MEDWIIFGVAFILLVFLFLPINKGDSKNESRKSEKQEAKKFEKNRMKVEKQNNPAPNSWLSGLIIGLLIAGAIWWFVSSDYRTEEEIKTDLVDCAQSCVSDMGDCTFSSVIYDGKRNAFIPNDEYEICELDLESCVDDCSAP